MPSDRRLEVAGGRGRFRLLPRLVDHRLEIHDWTCCAGQLVHLAGPLMRHLGTSLPRQVKAL